MPDCDEKRYKRCVARHERQHRAQVQVHALHNGRLSARSEAVQEARQVRHDQLALCLVPFHCTRRMYAGGFSGEQVTLAVQPRVPKQRGALTCALALHDGRVCAGVGCVDDVVAGLIRGRKQHWMGAL